MGERIGYRPALDGLRCFAVMAVVASHYQGGRFFAGFLGVDVFFVISGFLITRLLCEEHERNGAIDLPSFWWRRAFRLMPALWVLLAATATLGVAGVVDENARAILGSLLYVRNWVQIFDPGTRTATGHTWSLAVEEQFYLLWPLAFVFIYRTWGRRAVRDLAAIAAAICAVESAILAHVASSFRMQFGLDGRAGIALLAGAALGASATIRAPRWTGWVGAIVLAALATSSSFSFEWWGTVGYLTVTVATCMVIIEATRRGSLLERVLAFRPFVYVGTLSYSIYLWHFPMYQAAEHALGGGHRHAAYLFAATFLTIVTACASYYLVEQPCRERGRRWLAERRSALAVAH